MAWRPSVCWVVRDPSFRGHELDDLAAQYARDRRLSELDALGVGSAEDTEARILTGSAIFYRWLGHSGWSDAQRADELSQELLGLVPVRAPRSPS